MKKPVSVTLGADNLLWLKGQAAAGAKGSVSEVLDDIVSQARLEGRTTAVRSICGTIDLREEDLADSATYLQALFDKSLQRPLLVKEGDPTRTPRKPRRG